MAEQTPGRTPEEQAAYEARLRQRLEILVKEIAAGRVKFAPGMQVTEEVKAVRTLPDGAVDLSTVGAGVRALALAVEHMVNEREAKAVSLAWIQTQYFGLLEDILADVVELNKDRQLPPEALAQFIRDRPIAVESVLSQAEGIRQTMNDFWRDCGYVVEVHLRAFPGVKAVFGGDVFPSAYQNTPARAALYADTIVLPDPIHRVLTHIAPAVTKPQLAYQLIKHGLHALSLKEMVFAEVDQPMVVFTPSDAFEVPPPKWWLDSVGEDALFHVNSALGSNFASLDEATDFLRHIEDPNELASKAMRPDRLLYSTDWPGDLATRVGEHIERRKRVMGVDLGQAIADLVVQDAYGRMGQAGAHLYRSNQYKGLPLTDVPTSWKYLQWKGEYDAMRRQQPDAHTLDEAIANGLVRETEVSDSRLDRLSVEGLVALRKSGLIEDLRGQLRECLERLERSGETEDPKIAEEVVKLFVDGMRAAAKEIEQYNRGAISVAAVQIPAAGMATVLAIAGAVGGNYWLTAAAAAATQLGLPTVGSIWKRGKELVANGRKIAQSPFGVLVTNEQAPS